MGFENCTLDTCPLSEANVNYDPSLAGNLLYCILFGILAISQLGLGWYYKTWTFSAAMISGMVLEVIGYVGRIQMHYNPFTSNPFLIYLICLTIAPVFVTAAIYVCLGRIVSVYGLKYSHFQPRFYTIVFVTCDFIALVLQALGGALADTADTHADEMVGVNIMIAGLVFQVVSLVCFAALCGDFGRRVIKGGRETRDEFSYLGGKRKFHIFMGSLAVATLLIIIRSTFRVAELKGGFNSSLANNEAMLMVFDGAMMSLASILLTVIHPGPAFEGLWPATSAKKASKRSPGISTDTSYEELHSFHKERPSATPV